MQAQQEMVTKRPRLVVYLTDDVKQQFEQLAELRNRSASNLAETLIMKELWEAEKSGELPTKQNKEGSSDD